MKKKAHPLWQMLVLVVLGAATIFSLVIPERFLSAPEPKRAEISILIRQTDSALWARARLGMEQAAEDWGAELRFLTLSRDNNSDEQLDLLRREAEVEVDAAVVVPADCHSLSALLAEDWTLPVVTLESPVANAAACVSPENEQAGRLLAEQVARDFPDGGRALLIDGSPAADGPSSRLKQANDFLKQNGFTTSICSEIPAQDQLNTTDAVLCFEAQTLEPALQQALQCETPPPIYGAGVTDGAVARLEKGQIAALAVWDEYSTGYLAVTRAVAAARKQRIQDDQLPVFIAQQGGTYDPDYEKILYPIER